MTSHYLTNDIFGMAISKCGRCHENQIAIHLLLDWSLGRRAAACSGTSLVLTRRPGDGGCIGGARVTWQGRGAFESTPRGRLAKINRPMQLRNSQNLKKTRNLSIGRAKAYSSSCPQAVTHRSTNRTRRRVTSFQPKRVTTPPTPVPWRRLVNDFVSQPEIARKIH